jgi:autotransporter translocation and assembly factor TamB
MKISEFKESVVQVIRERSINAISKLQQRNIENIASALEFYKKNKHTDKKEPFIKLLKKLGKEKAALAKELDMKVSGMYKNAEYKGESVNEGASSEEKRIAMLAVKKQAKYRNVSLSQAIQDQINALEELKRQYKGK